MIRNIMDYSNNSGMLSDWTTDASDTFHQWWNPDKFDWVFSDFLINYCDKYKHIWQPELIIINSLKS